MKDDGQNKTKADPMKSAPMGPGKVSEKDHETKGQPFRAGTTDEGVVVNDNIGGMTPSSADGAGAGGSGTRKR